MPATEYQFSVDWVAHFEAIWPQALKLLQPAPQKIVEIGSYEGRSATWMIEHAFAADGGTMICIDTWTGGIEHNVAEMPAIEAQFDRNISVARARRPRIIVEKLKGTSEEMLLQLLAAGHRNSFDLV